MADVKHKVERAAFGAAIDGILINSDYTVNFKVIQADDNDYVKRVTVKVTYTVNNEEKSLEIRKLKIKEIS